MRGWLARELHSSCDRRGAGDVVGGPAVRELCRRVSAFQVRPPPHSCA